MHWHKYTTLKMYPPKHGEEWGFLFECACGHCRLPAWWIDWSCSIKRVEECRPAVKVGDDLVAIPADKIATVPI